MIEGVFEHIEQIVARIPIGPVSVVENHRAWAMYAVMPFNQIVTEHRQYALALQ